MLAVSERSGCSRWVRRGARGGCRSGDDDGGDGDGTAADSRLPGRRSRRSRDSRRFASRNAAASFSNNRRKNIGPLPGWSRSAMIPYCFPHCAARYAIP